MMWREINWRMSVVASDDEHQCLVLHQPPSATVFSCQTAKKGSTTLCSIEVVDPPEEEWKGQSVDDLLFWSVVAWLR